VTAARDAATCETDSGFATVWAAGAVLVLVALLAFGMHLAAAASGRHRAEAAADLAALAAAAHALDGEPVACAYAVRVVRGMHARLVSCRLSGWEAFVQVSVIPALRLPGGAEAGGRARAGPAAE
jgi:secretion/DNA translocation related TadE-like protein